MIDLHGSGRPVTERLCLGLLSVNSSEGQQGPGSSIAQPPVTVRMLRAAAARRGGPHAAAAVAAPRTPLLTLTAQPCRTAASAATAATVAAPRLARLFAGGDEQPLTGAQALRAAADVLLNFMSLTRTQSADCELAALRYLRLQELHVDPATGRSGLQRADIVPTRDISAVWASDLLRPTDMAVPRPAETQGLTVPAWYTHQQFRLLTSGQNFTKADAGWLSTIFGGAVGVVATPATAKFDGDGDGVLTEAERSMALRKWTAQYDATAVLWREHTGMRYRLPGALPDGVSEPEPKPYLVSTMRDQMSPERLEKLPQLLSGLSSQGKFTERILNLGPAVVNDAWLRRVSSAAFPRFVCGPAMTL